MINFIKRNPNNLYQNVMLKLGSTTKMEAPSNRTVDAFELLIKKIQELEEEIKLIKKIK